MDVEPEKISFMVRRGIVGKGAPIPKVTEHHWNLQAIMIMHSDGIKSLRHWKDFFDNNNGKPSVSIAQKMLHDNARPEDDATVIVIKSAVS